MKMEDKTKLGLFNKYNVTRADGTDAPGGKHHGCEYFVLDITHDPFALPAMKAYADACEKQYPKLARDLRGKGGVSVPRNGAAKYFLTKKAKNVKYLPKVFFDALAKQGLFEEGPFRDSFGDGPGEPYNPHRQAFGLDKSGVYIFTELSEG